MRLKSLKTIGIKLNIKMIKDRSEEKRNGLI